MKAYLTISFLVLFLSSISALTLQVEPKTTECFHQKVERNDLLTFEFIVTRGGLLDINLRITSPSGNIIHENLHFFQAGDRASQKIVAQEDGIYSFCFDNEMSRWTAKVVNFELTVEGKSQQQQQSNTQLLGESLKPLERSLHTIRRELDKITKEQRYLRVREQVHRDTQENTFVRVYWFSTLESVVLVGMCLFQIYFMRKWFDTDRRVRV